MIPFILWLELERCYEACKLGRTDFPQISL